MKLTRTPDSSQYLRTFRPIGAFCMKLELSRASYAFRKGVNTVGSPWQTLATAEVTVWIVLRGI